MYDLKPAVVCLCEASTNSSTSDAFLALDGYNLVVRADGTDTKEGWCRGLLIYVRLDVTAARLESSLIQDLVECEGVTIQWGNKGDILTLILVYRPPRAPGSEADNNYCDRFCDLLAGFRSSAIILGDLNLPGIDWDHLHASSRAEKNVLDSVHNYFWTQHVDFSTRKDPASGVESLLDPCFSSSPDLITNVESQGWFSDHTIYTADLVRPTSTISSRELVPDWSWADLDKLATNLAGLNWATELECMTGLEAWELFKEMIDKETEACLCP